MACTARTVGVTSVFDRTFASGTHTYGMLPLRNVRFANLAATRRIRVVTQVDSLVDWLTQWATKRVTPESLTSTGV